MRGTRSPFRLSPLTLRQQALDASGILGTPREERFDRIVRLAARLLDVPICMINLIADHEDWTKASVGLPEGAARARASFCRTAVDGEARLEVADLWADPRFSDDPSVTESPGARFYAGEPISTHGQVVGTLCVLDTRPRQLTEDQRALLGELADWVSAELDNSALTGLVRLLQEREQRLEALIGAVPEGVLLVTADGGVETANAVAEETFGRLPPGTAVIEDVFPGHAASEPPFRMRRAGEPSRGRPVEVLARSRDGIRFPSEVTVAQLPSPGPYRALVLARDLRRLVDAEEELRRQRTLTELLLASTAEGVVSTDRDGCVVFVNPAVRRMLGAREPDLVGRTFHTTAHHSHPDGTPWEEADCPLSRAVAEGTAVLLGTVLWRRDGSSVPVEVAASPIVTAGEVLGSVLTIRDVSERAQVEELKRQFTAVVSHELRTPLTAIKGSLSLVTSGVMGPVEPEQQRLLTMADRNADRLTLLVDDILDLERLDAGRMPLRPRPVDLADVAESAVEGLEGAARAADVALVMSERGRSQAHVDPERISQALVNLIGNAIKFSDGGGRVEVSCRREGGAARIAVRDQGPGIPEDQLQAVFDRFRQVHADAAHRQAGSGLGLAISKAIVERSGGWIELRSRLGEGSEFTIVLPLAGSE